MANEYITDEQARRRLVNSILPEQEGELGEMRESVSRAIDDYLDVPYGYFSRTTEATTRRIRGTGQSFIILPAPLYGAVTITAPQGLTVPDFDLDDGRLVTLDSSGNPSEFVVWQDVYYTIEGRWGYPEIPPVIAEAAKQLLVHFWRGKDKGFSGVVLDMQQSAEMYPERDFPRTTRRLLDSFALKLDNKAQGGLILA